MESEERPDKIIHPDGTENDIVNDTEPDAMTLCFQAAVDKAIADSFAKGIPVARMNPDGKLYWLYADGHREYIE